MVRLMTVVLLACLISFFPAQAAAADRPAAQWAWFTKVGNLKDCLGYAQAAMEKKNYKIRPKARGNDYSVVGVDGTVIVQVVCVPQKNDTVWIIVSAFSSDAKVAERACDEVQAYIKKQVRID